MKKSIGAVRALYPMPLTVVGVNNSRGINWINITHTGIVGNNQIMISLRKIRYTNDFLKKDSYLTINLITLKLLNEADYVGMVSGKNTNKKNIFNYELDKNTNSPSIKDSPVSMICKVIDIYETENHYQYILEIIDTIVDENVLTKEKTIDYTKFKPVLFEMENWIYLETGNIIGKCCSFGKELIKKK